MARGKSLHIGVNKVDPKHYDGWSGPLTACESDAHDMHLIATGEGYDTKILLTEEATRGAVIGSIEAAANALDAGDIFFMSFSGHGGQVPDLAEKESDRKDETWCLFDGLLIDDELPILWSKFKAGTRIFVLLDSCHSGSAVKVIKNEPLTSGAVVNLVSGVVDVEVSRFRAMPEMAAFRTFRANQQFYHEIHERTKNAVVDIKARVRLISGCQDHQKSLDGKFNGLFTGTLLRVWDEGAFEENYAKFHEAILARMPTTQSPNHLVLGSENPQFDAQRPFEI